MELIIFEKIAIIATNAKIKVFWKLVFRPQRSLRIKIILAKSFFSVDL